MTKNILCICIFDIFTLFVKTPYEESSLHFQLNGIKNKTYKNC